MEIPVRLGRVQSLQEHFQISTPHGILTKSLFDGVRGCCFSVHLQTPPKPLTSLSCLVFRNFYTSALRLEQVNTDGSSTVLLDEYPLMQHIHCEDDAQNWHLLQLDKLQAKIDVGRLDFFYVYLFQSSPLWEKWELQHLKFYEVRVSPAAASGSQQSHSPSRSGDEKLRSTDPASPTTKMFNSNGTETLSRSNSYASSSNSNQGDDKESRLAKRPSRMALLACVESRDAQENAAQCFDLVSRLRGLLHPNQP